MLDWKQAISLPEEELTNLDVAEMNLACAVGLPGFEKDHCEGSLRQIDHQARFVARRTEHLLPHFPKSGYKSEAMWRAAVLTVTLLRDLGARYNKAKLHPQTQLNPEDTFILGIFYGQGGTCASLPVLFAAVGRRLGYPIKLATTVGESPRFPGRIVGHVFARWEAPGERFNIDHYDGNLCTPPDEYYRQDYKVTPQMERDGDLLKSLSPREELAMFLRERTHCLRDKKEYRPAVESMIAACKLHGHYWNLQFLTRMLAEWHEGLLTVRPNVMPGLTIHLPPREFPWLPEELERDVFFMLGTELVLTHPEYAARWWGPKRQRRGYFPPGMPRHIVVRFRRDGAHIELHKGLPPSGAAHVSIH